MKNSKLANKNGYGLLKCKIQLFVRYYRTIEKPPDVIEHFRTTQNQQDITNSQMQIRKVKKEDNIFLATMIREVFEEYNAPQNGTVYSDPTTDNLFELFQSEQSVLWVAELEYEIVGCCGIYPTTGLPKKCAELVKFYLSAKSRGKGIGKTLMEKSVQSAREMGYSELYLESLPEFSNAVSIYEKQGFLRLNNPLGTSGHTTCNIWMLRKL